ncbi:glycosyltransferase family 8 protein [Methylobacterium crusticola]|uniref:glycosyltransferase family 8 protein n=1 Tax=Methylobacterium crusticola TaxID=1697972 RepID=UPI001EE2BAE6|nr:glycosyltransferase [Methylobacterium crusticola]
MTDRNYLFITLVSAIQARRNISSPSTDVIILSIDGGPRDETYRRVCDQEGIVFLDVAAHAEAVLRSALGDAYRTGFSGRISAATLVRLVISEFVPGHYQRMLYIDGDTQIYASLDPLLQQDIPVGKFFAARDYMSVMRRAGLSIPEKFSPDFDRLGLPPARRDSYFNAGVILSGFEDWKRIGKTALDYFVASGTLKFHDQDALNGACWEQHLLLASRWNFPRQFMHLRPLLRDRPDIIHFMANPKPWHGAILPWGTREHRAYTEVVRRHPALAGDIPRLSALRLNAYRVKSTYYHLRGQLDRAQNRRIAQVLDEPRAGAPSRRGGREVAADPAFQPPPA